MISLCGCVEQGYNNVAVPFCPLHGVPGLQHWVSIGNHFSVSLFGSLLNVMLQVGRTDFSLTNPMNGLYCSLHVDGL